MGITRTEFLRLLPIGVGSADYRLEGELVEGEGEGRRWRITFVEKPPRRIALIAMPVLEVTIACPGAKVAEQERFIARFLAAYQRAGG